VARNAKNQHSTRQDPIQEYTSWVGDDADQSTLTVLVGLIERSRTWRPAESSDRHGRAEYRHGRVLRAVL